MTFSLIDHAWIPVLARSGRRTLIRPSNVTADAATDPAVAIDWPRPDFRLATLEFLIGLLATTTPPEDGRGWLAHYNNAPDPEALDAAFAPVAHAFELDGPGPRFMQELGDFTAGENRVDALLIEAPGENTLKRNTDLLVKRAPEMVFSRAAAAMALYTLQTYAPSGGAGNRTSLRGGGPMTTLALPPGEPTLWQIVWANVPRAPRNDLPGDEDWPRIFPWLAPTRISDTNRPTTPGDTHALQAFWGMPRRIRLDFSDNTESTACGLTGAVDSRIVKSWRQRPWGAKYEQWLHTLSPYYKVKPTEPYLPVHPQPGGIGYRHFQGLLLADSGGATKVADCIEAFKTRARLLDKSPRPWRLLAAGFDMDNMKARGFAESEMPVLLPANPQAQPAYEEMLRQMIATAAEVAGLLGRAVRHALFSEGAKVDYGAAIFADVRERFWDATADPFWALAERLAKRMTDDARREWLAAIARSAATLFAEAAPIDGSGDGHPGRIAEARRSLGWALAGFGKDGRALFEALGLPLAESAKIAKQRREKRA